MGDVGEFGFRGDVPNGVRVERTRHRVFKFMALGFETWRQLRGVDDGGPGEVVMVLRLSPSRLTHSHHRKNPNPGTQSSTRPQDRTGAGPYAHPSGPD